MDLGKRMSVQSQPKLWLGSTPSPIMAKSARLRKQGKLFSQLLKILVEREREKKKKETFPNLR